MARKSKRPTWQQLYLHLRSVHGKRDLWFEELGSDADLEAAHLWEHATRYAEHEAGNLSVSDIARARAS